MATSPRQLIRRALWSALVGKTDAGPRVFMNRSEALQLAAAGGDLPALAVLDLGESAKLRAAAPREYERELRIGVEVLSDRRRFSAGYGRAGEQLGASELKKLERIAQQSEGLAFADPTLGVDCLELLHYRGTRFRYSKEQEVQVGDALLEFAAIYYTRHEERAARLAADWLRARVEWHVPDGDVWPLAVDDIPTQN